MCARWGGGRKLFVADDNIHLPLFQGSCLCGSIKNSGKVIYCYGDLLPRNNVYSQSKSSETSKTSSPKDLLAAQLGVWVCGLLALWVLAPAGDVPLLIWRRVQVDSAAPDPEVHHLAAEAHRASHGAAARLPRRGGHLHLPAPVARLHPAAHRDHGAVPTGICYIIHTALQC